MLHLANQGKQLTCDPGTIKTVEAVSHKDAETKKYSLSRYNSSFFVQRDQQDIKQKRYPRNTNLESSNCIRVAKTSRIGLYLVVNAHLLYIQEKSSPKALI